MLEKLLAFAIIAVLAAILLKETQNVVNVNKGINLETRVKENMTTSDMEKEILDYGRVIYNPNPYWGWLFYFMILGIVGVIYDRIRR